MMSEKTGFWQTLINDLEGGFKKPPASSIVSNIRDQSSDFLNLDAPVDTLQDFGSVEDQQALAGPGVDTSDRAYQADAEKILAIQRYSSKGFQIIDINPRLLDPTLYPCLVNASDLLDQEGNPSVAGAYGNPSPTNFTSVQLSIFGDFLKVDTQKSRYRNYADSVPFSGGQGSFIGKTYIQFTDNSSRPLVVRPGDEFTGYFSNVIITFPSGAPRFRLIIGYGTKIKTTDIQMESLHLGNWPALLSQGGGPGIQPWWSNNFSSAFTLSNSTALTTQFIGFFGGPTPLQNLNTGEGTVLWVTDLSVSAIVSADCQGVVTMSLGPGNSSALWSTVEKCIQKSGDTFSFTRQFQTPLRISLLAPIKVANWSIFNGSGANFSSFFVAINGYTVGNSTTDASTGRVSLQTILDAAPIMTA